MSDELQQNTEATATTAPGISGGDPAVQLQIQDLLLAAQTIQLAAQRGAFKAEEFTSVGGVYERLVGFLISTGAITKPESTDSTPAEPTPAAE